MADILAEIDKKTKHLQKQLLDGPLVKPSDLPAYIDSVAHQDAMDDRLLLLEKALVLLSRLNDSTQDSPFLREMGNKLEDLVIDLLYKDLPHPPSAYLSAGSSATSAATVPSGSSVRFACRSNDGSGYNPLYPNLGKAGSPYARSVPAVKSLPIASLPDPGLVFDLLLKRDKFVEHPGGISSLFFAYADLIIHSIFNTNRTDWSINDSSSYLDLSVLYGSSDAQVANVRRKDGTGQLWDDVFADDRLLLMPPATCALLVLLSRNHNYSAQKLYDINERGTFKDPGTLGEEERQKQDDEIFERARLVNSAYFVQIILGDYVGTILGLGRDGKDWRLNPLKESRRFNHEFAPRGEGNVIAVEFNLLYRWHATLSEQDAKWTQETFDQALKAAGEGSVTVNQLTPKNFHKVAALALQQAPSDVRKRTFHGLKRTGPDGTGPFKDQDIAKLIQNATDYRAGAFKARGVPEALRVVEILGIQQARSWGTCSLNEFRKFIGLKPYKTFEEWNSDKTIAAAARSLYKHIDNLELHVGLQAEEAKKPGPGAGLCPGYTISRAILADAVCLTRGDRFLTVDFTPYNLTKWGYDDCQFNIKDGSYGGMLTKLLLRSLPEYYEPRSAYAHFPFLVPSYMKDVLEKRDKKYGTKTAPKYVWERPPLPTDSVVVGNYADVQKVLKSSDFANSQSERLRVITGQLHKVPDVAPVQKCLVQYRDQWSQYLIAATQTLISRRSIKAVGSKTRYIDIVKDVINVLPVKWICEQIAALTIGDSPNSSHYTEAEYCRKFQDICQYVFLDNLVDDWELRESSSQAFRRFGADVKEDLKTFSSWIKDRISVIVDRNDNNNREFLKQLSTHYSENSTGGKEELVTALFCEMVPTAAHFSHTLAHVVNFYLQNGKEEARNEIVMLSKTHSEEARQRLKQYIDEALTADPPVSGVHLKAVKNAVIDGVQVKTGERVFASVVQANDTRPANEPGVVAIGNHGLTLEPLFDLIAPGIIGTIFSYHNLQHARGIDGLSTQFTRFKEEYRGVPIQQYITYEGRISPFPDSLLLQFEGDSE